MTTQIKSFPASKVQTARDALATAYARLVRHALKAGQSPPAEPTIVVTAERVLSRCNKCKVSVDGFAGGKCRFCTEGYLASFQVVDLEILAERPALAGWDFLAVIEPLDGGNLLRQVPGATVTDGELDAWRTGAVLCDHCKTIRNRQETFILRSDGTDTAIALGTYKQVGRNCLSAFLGGKSAASIVAMLAWPDIVRGAAGDDEGGFGGGSVDRAYDPAEFLGWTAAVVRNSGWVSKGAAQAYADAGGSGKQATASIVSYLLTPPWSAAAQADWRKAREEYKPTSEDLALGIATLAWARALEPTSDYERNLVIVARQEALNPSHTGLLASTISGYMRALDKEIARKSKATEPHVKAPLGKGIEFSGEIVAAKDTEGFRGGHTVKITVKVTTADGVWCAWGTLPSVLASESQLAARDLYVGRHVSIKASLELPQQRDYTSDGERAPRRENDGSFVFMSRPSGAYADLFGPVYVVPKCVLGETCRVIRDWRGEPTVCDGSCRNVAKPRKARKVASVL